MALVLSVGVTSLVLCIFGRDQTAANLEQLVSETHKQLETLKVIKVVFAALQKIHIQFRNYLDPN